MQIETLSAKSSLDIWNLNRQFLFFRVNFKGCVEKDELLKIVERLWRQERNDKDLLDKMEDDSICKICMDAPVSFYSILSLLHWFESGSGSGTGCFYD